MWGGGGRDGSRWLRSRGKLCPSVALSITVYSSELILFAETVSSPVANWIRFRRVQVVYYHPYCSERSSPSLQSHVRFNTVNTNYYVDRERSRRMRIFSKSYGNNCVVQTDTIIAHVHRAHTSVYSVKIIPVIGIFIRGSSSVDSNVIWPMWGEVNVRKKKFPLLYFFDVQRRAGGLNPLNPPTCLRPWHTLTSVVMSTRVSQICRIT